MEKKLHFGNTNRPLLNFDNFYIENKKRSLVAFVKGNFLLGKKSILEISIFFSNK